MTNTKHPINDLLHYNHEVNKKLIANLLDADMLPEKVEILFCHILNAHHVWESRIRNKKANYGVWQMHRKRDFIQINDENHSFSFQTITEIPLEKTITYKTTKGIELQNTVADILIHIANHSTYHRGQIALLLRQNGLEPMASDYIAHKRSSS